MKYQVQTGQVLQTYTAFQYSQSFSLLYFMLLAVVGFVLFFIVRWVVGLNGTESDVERQTFSFAMDYKRFAGSVNGKVFRSIGGLVLRERSRGHHIILANNPNGVGDKVVLGVSPYPDDPAKSILATVAYSASNHSIRKTEDASAYLEASLLYLEKTTGRKRETYAADSEIGDRVLAFALRRTRPSLGVVKDIPRYHLFALGFTVLLAIAMSLAFFTFKVIDQAPYVDSLVLIAVAAVIEFGPLVRESLSVRHEPSVEE